MAKLQDIFKYDNVSYSDLTNMTHKAIIDKTVENLIQNGWVDKIMQYMPNYEIDTTKRTGSDLSIITNLPDDMRHAIERAYRQAVHSL